MATKSSTKSKVKKTVKSVKSGKKPSTKSPQKPVKASKPIKATAGAVTPPKTAIKPASAKKPSKAPQFTSKYPRASTNNFREGSSYGICYDILVAHPEGMPRQQPIEALAKATGKSLKNAGYDVAVVTSARPEFRHASCRPGFICIREGDNVRLEVTATGK